MWMLRVGAVSLGGVLREVRGEVLQRCMLRRWCAGVLVDDGRCVGDSDSQ